MMFSLLSGAAVCADEGVARILIDRRLQERQVMLVRIDSQQIAFRDSAGLLRSEPTANFVAITARPGQIEDPVVGGMDGAAPGAVSDRRPAFLELADGQRFSGRLVAGSDAGPGEVIRWAHPLLGDLSFALDDVRQVALDGESAASESGATGDLVLLRNGDRMEGFIVRVGATVRMEIGGQERELPLERVSNILLSNPPGSLSGAVVWLRDGSIVACDELGPAALGEVALVPRTWRTDAAKIRESEAGAVRVPVSEVLAVALGAERLAPLGAATVVREEPAEGRRWSPPMRVQSVSGAFLGAPDVELPGPMLVEWELPAGAIQFSTTAELPRAMWAWGDCNLIVSVVAGAGEAQREIELFRSRINADNAAAPIRVGLGSVAGHGGAGRARLRITLDPGMHGPIQDQIILHRPLVLVDPPPG